MSRAWVWLQLIIGWLPIGALFTVLMMAAHGTSASQAVHVALRMMLLAALLGIVVHRWIARWPWPHPFRLRFIGLHLLAACLYSLTWFALNSLLASLQRLEWVIVLGPGMGPYLITGVWLYVMVAAVGYAQRAAARSAQLQALEARSQLAALRAQLHPHFLFNALHTVVQLIPLDAKAAVKAAEHLAAALRCTIEEQRDLLPLAEEWAFVQRYLALEDLRFGDRLQVQTTLEPAALEALLPSFALQTLIENAVRHAASPRIETTHLKISAGLSGAMLQLRVEDDGPGVSAEQLAQTNGTGLRRLRERLACLYGDAARLRLTSGPQGGCTAELLVPATVETAQ